MIRPAMRVSLSNPDPRFLNYPSFLAYTIALGNGALTRLGLIHERWQTHVLGRAVVASYGAATAGIAFLLAEALGAPLVGAALAGLWVAVLPEHVWDSHIAVTDVMMTFWITVVLLLSVRLTSRPSTRGFALCGVALGLAVGSKYTAALAGIAPLLALAIAPVPFGDRLRFAAVLGVGALMACFVVTPYSFLHWRELHDALAFEAKHIQRSHPGFDLSAPGWQYRRYLYQLAAAWPFSMGVPLYGCALAGFAWAAARRTRVALIPMFFILVYFLITGSWNFVPLRYYAPILVPLAVFAGWWQGTWITSGRPLLRAATIALAAAALAYTAVFTYQTTARFSRDTRIRAARWLTRNVKPGQRVLAVGNPFYLAIPAGGLVDLTVDHERHRIDLSKLSDFDLVQITSMSYLRAYREGRGKARRDYERLRIGRMGFRLVKRIEGEFLNRDFYRRLDPMFESYMVSPTLEIYAREGLPRPGSEIVPRPPAKRHSRKTPTPS